MGDKEAHQNRISNGGKPEEGTREKILGVTTKPTTGGNPIGLEKHKQIYGKSQPV